MDMSMSNFNKLVSMRRRIHEVAVEMTELKVIMNRTGDLNLEDAADRLQDAYMSLMDAASEVRAAIKYEKASRQ